MIWGMIDACTLLIVRIGNMQCLIREKCFMSVRKLPFTVIVLLTPVLAMAPSAFAGKKTPGTSIEAIGDNKLLKAGNAL